MGWIESEEREEGTPQGGVICQQQFEKSGWLSRCARLKQANANALGEIDGWVRGRMRSILRQREGGQGRGRGRDHHRWPNHSFTELGFFNLESARAKELISLRLAAHY